MTSGARSEAKDLLGLVESDCAAGELERVLTKRMGGPFAPLPVSRMMKALHKAEMEVDCSAALIRASR